MYSTRVHVHMDVNDLTNLYELSLSPPWIVLVCISPSLQRGGVAIITKSTLSSPRFGGFEVCKSAYTATSLQKLNPATPS